MSNTTNNETAIQQMNVLWEDVGKLLNDKSPLNASYIWANVRVPICFNEDAIAGFFENQQIIKPIQRLNFMRQLSHLLLESFLVVDLEALDKIIDEIFGCTVDVQRTAIKKDLFNNTPQKTNSILTDVPEFKIWSKETVEMCKNIMNKYGFSQISRTAGSLEQNVKNFTTDLEENCTNFVQKTTIDPYVFGLGAHLVFTTMHKQIYGLASPSGNISLRMDQKSTEINMQSVFFHEWFHMLDYASFYAARFPEYNLPLQVVDQSVRELHKNLIRMPANEKCSVDPYAELSSIITAVGQVLGHSQEEQLENIRLMKEVFHKSPKKNRRENLNTFINVVVLKSNYKGDLYPLIDDGIKTFYSVSLGLKDFYKYLRKGYSEFYTVSLQMDEQHYNTQRRPLRWYEKRQKYYSKPAEVLARSAEQFCAQTLGWDLKTDLGYPQNQEVKRTHELFSSFFNHLSTISLTTQISARKNKMGKQ